MVRLRWYHDGVWLCVKRLSCPQVATSLYMILKGDLCKAKGIIWLFAVVLDPTPGIELKVNQAGLVENSFLHPWMNLTGFEMRQVRRSALFLIWCPNWNPCSCMTSNALGSAAKKSGCQNSQAFAGWVIDTLETEKEERTWLDLLPEKKKSPRDIPFSSLLGKRGLARRCEWDRREKCPFIPTAACHILLEGLFTGTEPLNNILDFSSQISIPSLWEWNIMPLIPTLGRHEKEAYMRNSQRLWIPDSRSPFYISCVAYFTTLPPTPQHQFPHL